MKVDYCSDTHWDFIFNPQTTLNDRKINQYWKQYFSTQDSDTLIIAGDTGHYIHQDNTILKYLKRKYKNVIITLGNHNIYCIGKQKWGYKHWTEKFNHQKKIFEDSGIIVLDGDIVEIDGITFGGAMGWYDCQYFFQNGFYLSYGGTVQSLWRGFSNDSRLIPGITSPYDIWLEESPKIEKVLDKCEVMITHFQPSIDTTVFDEKYKHDKTNAFYSFNYDEQLKQLNRTKVWVYGHTHSRKETDIYNIRLLANPFGYKDENGKDAYVRTFEIKGTE